MTGASRRATATNRTARCALQYPGVPSGNIGIVFFPLRVQLLFCLQFGISAQVDIPQTEGSKHVQRFNRHHVSVHVPAVDGVLT